MLARLLRHRAARALATGECRCDDSRISNDIADGVRRHAQVLEQALWPASFQYQLFHFVSHALDETGMLQHADISGKDRRCEKTNDLPIREIPRHNGKHRALREPAPFSAAAIGQVPELRFEHCRTGLGKIMEKAGAFFHLAARLRDRLAHFRDCEHRQLFAAAFIKIAEPGQQVDAILHRATAPVAVGPRGGLQLGIDAVFIERFIFGDRLAGRGIDCSDQGAAPEFGLTHSIAAPRFAFRRYFRRKRKYQTSWP